MSVRSLRQLLTYLIIILITLIIVFVTQGIKNRESHRQVAAQITDFCQLPAVPDGLTIRHASIDRSENEQYIDVILALTGPSDTLDDWLEKVDQWEQKRPGVIQNHRTREAEMSSRVDFTAEVYLR